MGKEQAPQKRKNSSPRVSQVHSYQEFASARGAAKLTHPHSLLHRMPQNSSQPGFRNTPWVGQIDLMMRTAEVHALSFRELGHFLQCRLLGGIWTHMQDLNAAPLIESLQLDLIDKCSALPFRQNGLDRNPDFFLVYKLRHAHQQTPVPLFRLCRLPVRSSVGPPLSFEMAHLVVVPCSLLRHLQGERHGIQGRDCGREFLSLGRSLSGQRQILGWPDCDKHWFFGCDIFAVVLLVKIDFDGLHISTLAVPANSNLSTARTIAVPKNSSVM